MTLVQNSCKHLSMNTTERFAEALLNFINYANGLQMSQWTPTASLPADTISYETGKKYIKVFRNNYGDTTHRSVFCFIDMSNGDVLKAASWKAPAKGARGNIFFPDNYGISQYGANYNR